MQLDHNHITFQAQDEMREILEPLSKTCGINYFSYGINFPNKQFFSLTTHADYYEEALAQEFPLCGFHLVDGWHMWNSVLPKDQTKISQAKNLGNGIILVKHHQEMTEIVEFATDVDNKDIYDFYMNKSHLLRGFVNYFQEKTQSLIAKAKEQTLTPLPSMTSANKNINVNSLNNDALLALNKIIFASENPNEVLSKRELECFLYLIKGYSIAEMSKENALAIPTIANYIFRVKQKLQCFNRKDMIERAHQLGLISYADYVN